MPRVYRLGARKASAEETRTRVLAAARERLASGADPRGFNIDAIARAADVARMTVYYQFGTKSGLIQALFDDLASRGGMQELAAVFQRPDPREALDEFIDVFCRFWASDQLLFRRLRALATLDPELERELNVREQAGRHGARLLLQRLAAGTGKPRAVDLDRASAVVFTLTGFHTFDTLQSQLGAETHEISAILRKLAHCALDQF